MKFVYFIMIFPLLSLLSCTVKDLNIKNESSHNNQFSDIKKEKIHKQPVYKFSYSPYDSIEVQNKEAYNYAFNIILNKLIYFIEKTIPNNSINVIAVFELKPATKNPTFQERMNGKAVRGWNIYDENIIPIAERDIEEMSGGFVREDMKNIPKAFYYIEINGNMGNVYIRYWILQFRNFDFIYNLEKNGKWRIVNSQQLN